MFSWSWTAFIAGNVSGVFVTLFLLALMHLGARNDEVKPSVPEKKPEKRRDVH